jgi:hypothetical protein
VAPHVCLCKRSEGFGASVAKRAAAQPKRSDGNIVVMDSTRTRPHIRSLWSRTFLCSRPEHGL